MDTNSSMLVASITRGAEQYTNQSDVDQLVERAAVIWHRIDAESSPDRPTLDYVRGFIESVLKGALRKTLKKLTGPDGEVIAITLTFATQELVTYLITDVGLTVIAPYQIPLEIIAGVFYLKLLKEANKRMRSEKRKTNKRTKSGK